MVGGEISNLVLGHILNPSFNLSLELLTPGKLLFPEELFSMGSMFMRNKDKNGLPICNFNTRLKKRSQY